MNEQICDPHRLSVFLLDGLEPEAERALTEHLNQCEACCESLHQQVADEPLWREASEMLSNSPRLLEDTDTQIEQVLAHLAPTDDPESLGRIGGYEVTGVIGSGGMGVVLKAHDRSLDRVVAVKVMAPHLAASGSARGRFAREAKAAAAVLHPNVIAIHGVSNEQSLPYLVMPYVRGASLQKRIDAQGPLTSVDILRIGSQVAAGLAAAHERGLVHRDIKPANILLEQGVERVTITDFGLARAVDDASMTRSGVIAGTPQYMSPEQARGEVIDTRSDLFSLGSLLYAMCTGRSPFRAETSFGVLHRITHDSPRPISEINPDIPLWLERIVMKLLSKAPEDRFESAAEVAETLDNCLAHTRHPNTTPLPKSVASLSASRDNVPPWIKSIASAAFVFSLLLAGVLIVLQWSKGTLTIESEINDVPIRIMQGDELVDRLTVTKAAKSVHIAAGTYVVEIDGKFDGVDVQGGTVSLKRGAQAIVKIVSRSRSDAAVANPETTDDNASSSKPYGQSEPELVKNRYDRIPIQGPTTYDGKPQALDPPSDEEILAALEKQSYFRSRKLLQQHMPRSEIKIIKEKIADYVDPKRSYPLIGVAQLHHAHYKCTIRFADSFVVSGNPAERRPTRQLTEVLYVDHTHFHMVGESATKDADTGTPDLQHEFLQSIQGDWALKSFVANGQDSTFARQYSGARVDGTKLYLLRGDQTFPYDMSGFDFSQSPVPVTFTTRLHSQDVSSEGLLSFEDGVLTMVRAIRKTFRQPLSLSPAEGSLVWQWVRP